jgi:hypothetical protein
MTIPTKYIIQPRASPTYDFVDFAQGIGYKRFWGCGWYDSADAKQYFLTTQQVGAHEQNMHSGTIATDIDLDFDVTFNIPIIVEAATALLQFFWTHGGGNDTSCTVYVKHVRGATETTLGSVESQTLGAGAAQRRYTFPITLTRKFFAIGDILRLNFTWTVDTGAGGSNKIHYDPSNRETFAETSEGYTVNTDLSLWMPFKLEQ